MGTILIIDDDAQLRQSFEKLLTEEGHAVKAASTGETGIAMVRESVPDLVVTDVRLPGMNGLKTFKAIREIDPKLPVIVMTAFGTTETAIEATKLGAFDYVLKPFEIPDILALIEQALDAGRFMHSKVEINVAPDTTPAEAIIGQSKAMQGVYKAIGHAAPTDATVLIRGETGTGKELVARAIYQHSLRADKPFLVVNCVAIPETLLESELFGYEKGAFTGALRRRVGKIQQAHGGTVFLDEIGDMPFTIQAKLLRLLQEKSIERLGSHEPIPVDVRIIAATNRDLETAIAEGLFREDLYYRLRVVSLWLPPLQDRTSDIPLLANYFLAKYATKMGARNPGMSEEAKVFLSNQPWPGHVRELANAINKALIFSRGGPISVEDISRAVGQEPASIQADKSAEDVISQWIRQSLTSGAFGNMFNTLVDQFASVLITEALKLAGGNRTRAAKLLGLSRPTLLSKITKYRLKIRASVKSD